MNIMSRRINLLPWREQRRQQVQRQFIGQMLLCVSIAIVLSVVAYFFLQQQLQQQQGIQDYLQQQHQSLDQQLSSVHTTEDSRQHMLQVIAAIEQIQGQRPISVRLIDEIARTVPEQVYLTRVQRIAEKFQFEGRAKDPEVVADYLRRLDASIWFRNVFMQSFVLKEQSVTTQPSSLSPRIEEQYGYFVITADVGELASNAPVEPTANTSNTTTPTQGANHAR